MTENTIPFDELMQQVLEQLKNQGYMDSTLAFYRRIYNRVHVFINQLGTDIYTKEAGEEFLHSTSVCKHTLTAYVCAIRRLDDCIDSKPYKCHHDIPSQEVTAMYAVVLDEYLDECKKSGNAPATIHAKKRACVSFLNNIEQAGCLELSALDAGLVSQALLIYSNKDNYAIIRLFLKFLADRGIIRPDLSRAIPRYKRRKVLPTTYTPEEIGRVESSINPEFPTLF